MDIIEKAFEKFWIPSWKKRKNQDSTVHLDSIKTYTQTLACFFLEKKSSEINIVGSRFYVGFNAEQLHLPDHIGISSDSSVNKKMYFYLIILSCEAENLKLLSGNFKNQSRIAKRIEFLSHMATINSSLDKKFPKFRVFQKEISDLVIAATSNIQKNKYSEIYNLWLNAHFAVAAQKGSAIELLQLKQKTNDHIPYFLFCSTPCLNSKINFTELENKNKPDNKTSDKKPNVKQKKHTEQIKEINLEKEKKADNPVMHAFEKMDTLDDYQGGSRTNSGDDELDAHQNALDELEMNNITIDGENSQSVYQDESMLSFHLAESQHEIQQQSGEVLSYPEWNNKLQMYHENHCQLFIDYPLAKKSAEVDIFLKQLKEKHAQAIQNSRQKILSIANQPVWLYRQKDGSEIDIDALSRYLINLKAGNLDNTNFYTVKKNIQRDIAVCFLFDQSLSTDSWIQNQRVLDVTIESLCLAGMLFKDLIHNIEVAGTWSATRNHCHYICYKNLQEDWSRFYSLSKSIEPTGYTRIGPALRNATNNLKKSNFKKKILILITDGKPTDLDRYEGKHGIKDIKKAYQEARDEGIYTYALTIGSDDKSYFQEMFQNYKTIISPGQFSQELIYILLKAIK